MSLVEVENLCVRYGRLEAVKSISFRIAEGEVFGFIGPNGAGKSSTIKVLATLLRPTSGTARLQGVDIPSNPLRIRRRIGYVPDFFGVYEDLTVDEYLHFFAAAFRIHGRKRRGVVEDVLALTDLTGKRRDQVDALSRGMKQRLSLARVLLHDPALLLLDEPASGLDPRARIEMRELLKELRAMGKTILISSHILQELSHLCTHIGIIEAGTLIADGSVEEIFRRIGLQRVIHVQLAGQDNGGGPPAPIMLDAIRRIPGVENVEQEVDRLSVRIVEDQLAIDELLLGIQQTGARVRMFQPEALDMETAFMKLTQGRLA
ncbi:MAG: multidrug ABC transporter ATP-binding protein [Phycisphaeraceae bacterium]|nr:multidrug ABC transporter ATP-binding protein [Phycisphaeraceae bacterium]